MSTETRSPKDLESQLARLLNSKPETGEQWAEICRIEAEIAALVASPDDQREAVIYLDPDWRDHFAEIEHAIAAYSQTTMWHRALREVRP